MAESKQKVVSASVSAAARAGAAVAHAGSLALSAAGNRGEKRVGRDPGPFYRELVRGVMRAAQVEVARGPGVEFDGDVCEGLAIGREASEALRAGAMLLLEGWDRGVGGVADAGEYLSQAYQSLLELRPTIEGEQLLLEACGGMRTEGGSWFTPRRIVEGLLEVALEPGLRDAGGLVDSLRVCDPACGAGAFLAAAAERLAQRVPMARVLERSLYGVDVDPVAVELCRFSLWLKAPARGAPWMFMEQNIRHGDALALGWRLTFLEVFARGGFDLVIGNPPFLNRLDSATAQREQMVFLRERFGGLVTCYADAATAFLVLGAELVREGGRLAMIQPQSLLAARDAGDARGALAREMSLESIWFPRGRVFSACVQVCAPVLVRDGLRRAGMVVRYGDDFSDRGGVAVEMGALAGGGGGTGAPTWSPLVSDLLGVPRVRVKSAGVLGDLAELTADFRDQYYGLRGAVAEGLGCGDVRGEHPKLVSTGLIELGRCAWGERSMRFDGRKYEAPRVDVGALDEAMRRWAALRLRPKVLLATQTRVIEAAVDEGGELLPVTPLIAVVARGDSDSGMLWRIAAALCAPPVSALALERHAGAALSAGAIKLSAKQAAMLPLPADEGLWAEGAGLIRDAGAAGAEERAGLLREFGRVMCGAYGVAGVERDAVMGWWEGGSKSEKRKAKNENVVRA